MSKIKKGQKVVGKIAEILNDKFAAKNAQGKPLSGWQRSAWPVGKPFLINRKDPRHEEAVVWFPFVSDKSKAGGVAGWFNLVSIDAGVITTKYVGKESQGEIYAKVARFIGKNHIVFARKDGLRGAFEFLGVYTSERKGEALIYRRIADTIETDDWQR